MKQTDPITILQELIRCPSVTPEEGGALTFIQKFTEKLGFQINRPVFSEKNTPDIENLYARLGQDGPHLMFAGHTDVVPTGDTSHWSHPPFNADIANNILYGRGAVDMKGGIACFLAALARILEKGAIRGSISLLITGDEEGPAINGTVKLLKWAAEKGQQWDASLVGEPTNPDRLGEMIKIGRRGSLSGVITVHGQQGHVAYPHLANNPLPAVLSLMNDLINMPLDQGSTDFQPSNLELTSIDCGNSATNVIPDCVHARFNIRYNDCWNIETLKEEIVKRLDIAVDNYNRQQSNATPNKEKPIRYELSWLANPAEVFLTRDEKLINALSKAIHEITGITATLSTSGGTSDARYIKDYCPVVEFGLVGQTMHKIDECVPVTELEQLTTIYERFIMQFFA